ncbi:hypothetical protein ACFQJ7_07760 [Halovenus rubra]|uniref:Uncharacterized protein n=2 Tax=Halovenus rubra TaxID=869890 RepID=A0ABD5X7D8_9EURY|nr:hypothetical protein [Halovenus rubra]
MTREAVVEGFEHFITDAIETTVAEFSVARAVQNGSRGATGAAVDRLLKNSETLHKRVVQPELNAYRRQTLSQFHVVLDCVEAGETIDDNRSKILSTGGVAESIRTDISQERRERVMTQLLDHHRGLGNAVEPLLASPKSEFWAAARSALNRKEAERLVSEHFAFADPLRQNRDAFEMLTTIDISAVLGGLATVLPSSTIEVEYTDEAVRAMYRAQQSVIQSATSEVDHRFE